MTPSLAAPDIASVGPFDLWADVYDQQLNPMLQLEERVLPRLLPAIPNAHILDVGCGTGRWLQRFEPQAPASLTGCDLSVRMLEQARHKVAPTTALHLTDSATLPCADRSCDLVLASFVLGYLQDLATFAAECARVLKPGGSLLLSDLHPVTATQRCWTRGFRLEQQSISLTSTTHLLPEILAAFTKQGLGLCAFEEPAFGPSEQAIFMQAGKHAEYLALTHLPAIYLIKFKKQLSKSTGFTLAEAPWSAGPDHWNDTQLSLREGFVQENLSQEELIYSLHVSDAPSIDLTGYVLLPGLINAHDHLEFALFSNLGRAPQQEPYRNSPEWAREIHQTYAAAIERHLRVPLETRLWWGAIRNLLCGVTTVCHHNRIYPELLTPDFPIHIVTEFGWSHSLSFAEDLVKARADTPQDRPFLLHAAEGTDESSRQEIHQLHALGLLGPDTVLIHGLALTSAEVALLNATQTSLILCPSSNGFLFHQTLAPELLSQIDRVALGSDSPLTAAGDLLDELRFLSSQAALPSDTLYRLVTTQAADILHLKQGQGAITPGTPADLIATPDRHLSPSRTLAALTFAEIELVLVAGRVQLASPTLYRRLPADHQAGLELLTTAGHERWLRAPIARLYKSAAQALDPDPIRLSNKEVQCSSSR